MTSLNLSEWALRHKSFVVYLMLVSALAGYFAYGRLGREEDPPFTIKTMVIKTLWPGATATETVALVTDRIEPAVAECERVRVASENAAENADLQGILLAQSGKLEQAELELKRHLEWLKTRPPQLYERLNGLLVEQWISDLETGKNPFDKAVLEQLRKGE